MAKINKKSGFNPTKYNLRLAIDLMEKDVRDHISTINSEYPESINSKSIMRDFISSFEYECEKLKKQLMEEFDFKEFH